MSQLTNNTSDLQDVLTAVNALPDKVTVEALSVTENGTYTAPSGKAYSPVTVNVSGGGGLPELPLPSEWSGTAFTLDKDYQISQPDPELGYWELPEGYTLNIPNGTKLVVQESVEEFDTIGEMHVGGDFQCFCYSYIETPIETNFNNDDGACRFYGEVDPLNAYGNGYIYIQNVAYTCRITNCITFIIGTVMFFKANECRVIEVFGAIDSLSGTVETLQGEAMGTIIIPKGEELTVFGDSYVSKLYVHGTLSYAGESVASGIYVNNMGGTITGIPSDYITNWQRV